VQRLLAPNAVIQFNSQWPPFSSVGRRGWAKATDMVEDAFTAARRSTAPAPYFRDGKTTEVWGMAENDAPVDPFLDGLPD